MAALRMREIAVRMTRIHQWTSQYCQTFHGTIRNFRSLTGTSYNFRISRGHQYLSSISTNMGKLGNTRMCPHVSGCYREMHRTISPNRMPHNHQGELRTTREHWGVMWCKHTHTHAHTQTKNNNNKNILCKSSKDCSIGAWSNQENLGSVMNTRKDSGTAKSTQENKEYWGHLIGAKEKWQETGQPKGTHGKHDLWR